MTWLHVTSHDTVTTSDVGSVAELELNMGA